MRSARLGASPSLLRVFHLPKTLPALHTFKLCCISLQNTHQRGGNVDPWIDWIWECNTHISMPSHGKTSPVTAPTHCWSKKIIKKSTSHTSLWKSELGCHPCNVGAELWRFPNYRLKGTTVTLSCSRFTPHGFLLVFPPSTGSLGQDSCSTAAP